MILRPYQTALVDACRASLQQGHRAPLLVAPCGSGKTVCFSYFAHEVSKRGKRTLILAHRDELLDQISDTLGQFDVPHSFIAAQRPYDARPRTHVASVFSVARRLHKLPTPDIIILDEAHHAIQGSTWAKVLAAYPRAYRIGVTATPQRLSGEPLNAVFDDLILGPSVEDLIALHALCPYRIYVPSTINTEAVHRIGGDFQKGELAAVADKASITGDAIQHYQRLAPGKRAVAFCVSIAHAQHVARQFADAGIPALALDGTMARDVRRGIVADFRADKIKVLATCDLISEGFDLPALEAAIMLRPTASLALWIQQSGRALRPYPGKAAALILDHAGNTFRHGFPDDPRAWTLDGRAKINGASAPKLAVRLCSACFAAQRPGASVCRFCGALFPLKPRTVKEHEGELEELDPALVRLERDRERERATLKAKQEQGRAQSIEQLVQLGRTRGYKYPERWAWLVNRARQQRKLAGVQS